MHKSMVNFMILIKFRHHVDFRSFQFSPKIYLHSKMLWSTGIHAGASGAANAVCAWIFAVLA